MPKLPCLFYCTHVISSDYNSGNKKTKKERKRKINSYINNMGDGDDEKNALNSSM